MYRGEAESDLARQKIGAGDEHQRDHFPGRVTMGQKWHVATEEQDKFNYNGRGLSDPTLNFELATFDLLSLAALRIDNSSTNAENG